MKKFFLLFILTAAVGLSVGCASRRYRSQPVSQRDATIEDTRVEELERSEKTEAGPWKEVVK